MFKKWLIVVCAASCCMLLLQTVALFGAHADVESFGEELEGGISTEEGQPELSFEELLELMRIEEALEGQNDPGPVNGDRWFNVPEMKSLTCPNGEILTIPLDEYEGVWVGYSLEELCAILVVDIPVPPAPIISD